MFDEAVQRWNWINAFLTASLHAAIANLGQQPTPIFTFKDLMQEYIGRLHNALSGLSLSRIPQFLGEDNEIEYIFQLESEVWGNDWEHYFFFF
jgi:hypothetical protein